MIKEFIANIKQGALARTNRFAILFSPPGGMPSASMKKILLFCSNVSIPGSSFQTTPLRIFGEQRETPYEKMYEPITMSFYVDNELKVKQLFDEWMNLIQDPMSRTFGYYNDYTTPIVLEVQDLNDKTRYEVVLYECYPKAVGAIALDTASRGDVMKLDVTIQYKYFLTSPISVLGSDEKISTGLIDKLMKNFTGVQETINKTLGTRLGNFVTGSALTLGVTKLPKLLKF